MKVRSGLVLCVLVGVLIAIGSVVFSSQLAEIIVVCGNHLCPYTGDDLVRDYSVGVIWAVVLGLGISFWPVPREDRRALRVLWAAKVFAALVLALAYEYKYGLDPDGYFTNANDRNFVWTGFSLINGTSTMQNLTWLHLWLTPGSYHGAKVGFAMIGLVAIYFFYRAAMMYWGRSDVRVLLLLGLFPSILFWSSILGKDPFMLLGMALYTYGTVHWYRRSGWWGPLGVLCGGAFIAIVRLWYLPIVLAPLMVLSFRMDQRPTRKLALFFFALLFLGYSARLLGNIVRNSGMSLLEYRAHAATGFEGGGSSFNASEVVGPMDALRQVPAGIITVLFRPLPFEIPNVFGFLQGLDNLFLVVLFLMAICRTRLKELLDPMILWALTLVVCWGFVIGLVAYNFGTLARYKLQILPVFLLLLLYLSRRRAIVARRGATSRSVCAG